MATKTINRHEKCTAKGEVEVTATRRDTSIKYSTRDAEWDVQEEERSCSRVVSRVECGCTPEDESRDCVMFACLRGF